MATRIDDDGEHEVAAKTLQSRRQGAGTRGATLPADGIVTLGQASLNESMLTGEQLPLLKQAGDPPMQAPSTPMPPGDPGQPFH